MTDFTVPDGEGGRRVPRTILVAGPGALAAIFVAVYGMTGRELPVDHGVIESAFAGVILLALLFHRLAVGRRPPAAALPETPTGWWCPRCKRANAPHVLECGCSTPETP